MAEMTDDEILTRIEAEEQASLGPNSSDLAADRERAIRYYNGELDIKAPEGRSSVISTDVRDAIDGMLPDLLDIFLSSDEVVKFEPQGREDEAAAKQSTDLCNYIFYRQNPGALILLEWFKTAMMEKNGIVKTYHEKYAVPRIEKYEKLTEFQFQALVNDPNLEITTIQHQAFPDPMAQGMSLHDATFKIIEKNGRICVKGVPSEEWMVSGDHASLCLYDCRFVEHRRHMSVSEIRAMGHDIPDDIADFPESRDFTPEYNARRRYEAERLARDKVSDPASREVDISECSILIDADGDGYAERRRIVKIGREILENEYDDFVPFAAICPVIMPYRFNGLSVADLLMDIQATKSVIQRGMLDSLYFALNPRIGVTENQVNLDDLLVSRPGGVVRFKGPPGQLWQPIEHKFVGQQAFPMMEYQDNVKENRTGWTRYSQGLDADSLNKTATGIGIITNSAQKRMKLMARMFGETGLKDLFRGIMHLAHKHDPKPQTIRLRNQWIDVDPRQFRTGWDMSVNVGLGTGDKAQQAQQLAQVMQVQDGLTKMGKGHMVTDENLYNASKRIAETAGFKQEGEFFTAPGPENPPPEQPPPPEIVKIQADAQKAQAQVQSDEKIKLAEIQNGQQVTNMQSQTQIEVAKIKAASDQAIAQLQIAAEREIAAMKIRSEAEKLIFETDNDRQTAETDAQRKAAGGNNGDESASRSSPIKIESPMVNMHGVNEKTIAAILKEIKGIGQAQSDLSRTMLSALTAEKEVVRDQNGNIRGTRTVTRH